MTKVGILEDAAGLIHAISVHEHAPWQDADRSIEDTHMDICEEMRNVRILQQCIDEGQQHRIVGPHEFLHEWLRES